MTIVIPPNEDWNHSNLSPLYYNKIGVVCKPFFDFSHQLCKNIEHTYQVAEIKPKSNSKTKLVIT